MLGFVFLLYDFLKDGLNKSKVFLIFVDRFLFAIFFDETFFEEVGIEGHFSLLRFLKIMKYSASLLRREIELLQPVLIVTVGGNAGRHFEDHIKTRIPKEPITHYSYFLRPDKNGRKPMDPERIKEYREEFRRIRRRYEKNLTNEDTCKHFNSLKRQRLR